MKIKITLLVYALMLIILISSCRNENVKKKDIDKVESGFDYYQFQLVNLNPYDIPTSILLPDETAGIGNVFKPEIIHDEGSHLWTIQVGRNFILEIEDMGEIDDFLNDFKKDLVNNKVLKHKIIRDQKEIIIYSRTIQTRSDVDSETTYFIFAQKRIKNRNYSFRNRSEGNSLNEILYMEKSIESINLKEI